MRIHWVCDVFHLIIIFEYYLIILILVMSNQVLQLPNQYNRQNVAASNNMQHFGSGFYVNTNFGLFFLLYDHHFIE